MLRLLTFCFMLFLSTQVEARITFGASPTIISSTGIQTPTVQNPSTGQYTFTFPTPDANNSYGVLVTARSTTPYFMTYGSVATTGVLITFIRPLEP